MIVVTAGARYIDIDAYACAVAYAELLRLQGMQAVASSQAPINESVTLSLRQLAVPFDIDYQPNPNDQFVLVDISDPEHFDTRVDLARVTEVFDHRPGFESYWQSKLGSSSHIEVVGAAATLIYEAWVKAGLQATMSHESAMLLATAILDNTLFFGAHVTTERDHAVYDALTKHAALPPSWASSYGKEWATITDVPQTLAHDTKLLQFAGYEGRLSVGQLVTWDGQGFLSDHVPLIRQTMERTATAWFVNVLSMRDQRSYLICTNNMAKTWLEHLLGVTFIGDTAVADRLWLRKEIMWAAEKEKTVQ